MASLREVMVALDQSVEKACVELAVNLTANLTEVTPVDTGWARANWVPSLSAPSSAGGTPPKGDVGAAAKIAQESGLAEVLAFKLGDGSIWVSNNVPYVARLNDGSSAQAPAGFVEAAIDKTIAEMRPA